MKSDELELNHATHERARFLNGLEEEIEDLSNLSIQELASEYLQNNLNCDRRTKILDYVIKNLSVKESKNFDTLISNPNLISINEFGSDDTGDYNYNP